MGLGVIGLLASFGLLSFLLFCFIVGTCTFYCEFLRIGLCYLVRSGGGRLIALLGWLVNESFWVIEGVGFGVDNCSRMIGFYS